MSYICLLYTSTPSQKTKEGENIMERIHAVTFAPFCARGTFEEEETRQSLKLMKEKTGANYVIFATNGVQKTAFSENIDYRTKLNVSDEELTAMIAYAKQLGLKAVSYTHLDVYKRQILRRWIRIRIWRH